MSPASFRQWLGKFTFEQSAIGDLARDVRSDPSWPRGPGDVEKYARHLFEHDASDAAFEALRLAWERYLREHQSQRR